MLEYNDVAPLVALPVGNLNAIAAPRSGMFLQVADACQRNFDSGPQCRLHYERLIGTGWQRVPVACPFGFASCVVEMPTLALVLTGFVPFPRLGGVAERRMAKKYPHLKIEFAVVQRAAAAVRAAVEHIYRMESDAAKKQSMALHEIRKLNRTVKQTAERLCALDSPLDPQNADPQLVQIWKSSELMSRQFDAVEVLANESLTQLPVEVPIEVYRIFDKCVRIYRMADSTNRIHIRASPGYSPRILACDKTFSIIPSVLIENALKYSLPDSNVTVEISQLGTNCVVRVTNQSKRDPAFGDIIFKKGFRLSTDRDGSGNGLYLAKMVTEQHKGELTLSSRNISSDVMECTITVRLPEKH